MLSLEQHQRDIFIFSEWWHVNTRHYEKMWNACKLCSWQQLTICLGNMFELWENSLSITAKEQWHTKIYLQAGICGLHMTNVGYWPLIPSYWEKKHWTYEITLTSPPVCPSVLTLLINCPCSARSHWSCSPSGTNDAVACLIRNKPWFWWSASLIFAYPFLRHPPSEAARRESFPTLLYLLWTGHRYHKKM